YTHSNKPQNIKDASESLDIYANIGSIHAQRGVYDSARYYFQIGFSQLKPGITEIDLLHNSTEEMKKIKKIYYLTRLIIDKGDAYRIEYEVTRKNSAIA